MLTDIPDLSAMNPMVAMVKRKTDKWKIITPEEFRGKTSLAPI
ncbi:MAG TPA: hypothetical protein VGK38_00270 [Prolixibacteraceae bacterium]